MELLIKPNWTNGRLDEVGGIFRFERILSAIRFRFNSDTSFLPNEKLLIIFEDGTEARCVVASSEVAFPLGFVIEVELLSGDFSSSVIRGISRIEDEVVYELDGQIDLQLNMRIFDIEEIERSSTFTSTFDLPFTDVNNRILTQIFNINVDGGYNWNKKSDLIISDGGAIISTGYIQIEEIDWSQRIYRCIFYGDNKNLFDDLGDNLIFGNPQRWRDIDFTDVVHSVSEENVRAGWADEKPWKWSVIQSENTNLTKDNFVKGIEPHRWKMWWNTRDVLRRIFNKWGWKWKSEFLDSPLFRSHLTLPRTDAFSGGEIIKWNNQTTNTDLGLTGSSVIPLSNEIINLIGAQYNSGTGRWTIPLKGDYYANAYISFGPIRTYFDPTRRGKLDEAWIKWSIFRKGILIGQGRSRTFTSTFIGDGNYHITIPYLFIQDEPLFNGAPLLADDEILFELEYDFRVPYTMFAEAPQVPLNNAGQIGGQRAFPDEPFTFISISGSKVNVNPAVGFLGIRQADFVGDIFKQFNLYIMPDREVRGQFIIEPRDDFYKSGKIVDFLEFDTGENVLITTLNTLSAKEWRFTYSPGDDTYNQLYQNRFSGRVFGDALVRLDGDFLEEEKTIELSAQPIIYSKVFDNVILPDIEGGRGTEQIRWGFWNGTQSFQPSFTASYLFPIPLPGPPTPYTYYPLITNYSAGISTGETLLFATEQSAGGLRESSLYFNYWENEINTYAEPGSHLLTIRVRLTSTIYSRINWNDIYWIELDGSGRYYTLLEIKNWNPDGTDLVECVFLTYLDKREERIKFRPVFGVGNQAHPADTGFGNSPIPILRRGNFDGIPVDDVWTPNSPVRGNGWNIRGRDSIFTGVNEYGTLIGDDIIVQEGSDRVWIAGNDIIVAPGATSAFVWGANDVNISAPVVSWGATGKTHSVASAFLFNEYNPVLESKDPLSLDPQQEDGMLVWNSATEILSVYEGGVWIDLARASSYVNFFDFTSGSVTPFAASNTWVLIGALVTEGYNPIWSNLTTATNGEITYSGPTRVYKAEAVVSGSGGSNNEYHFAFFLNGSIWPCSEQSVVTSGGGRAASTTIQCLIELNPGDLVDVRVKNSSGTADFTLQNINVIIGRMM